MMTRKDYVEVAAILRRHADKIPAVVFSTMVKEFACMFEADNDRFDRSRFVSACYPDPRRD